MTQTVYGLQFCTSWRSRPRPWMLNSSQQLRDRSRSTWTFQTVPNGGRWCALTARCTGTWSLVLLCKCQVAVDDNQERLLTLWHSDATAPLNR